jgi:hypothetical protein
MAIELPQQIKDCFVSTALTIDKLTLGKPIWVVNAHGKLSRVRKLTAQAIKAFEQFTPNGVAYFSLYLIAKDDKKQVYHMCVEDINLNQNSKHRYTNHFSFSSKEEAEYYYNLCVEFNIHSLFEPSVINNTR